MATVSERSRELSNEFCRWATTETLMDDLAAEHLAIKIEQALLAERRLAMEEAAVIVETSAVYNTSLAGALRAAAEKEVGT